MKLLNIACNKNELVHASINTTLSSLKPINFDYLFATDSLSLAIACALGKLFPKNSIITQTYYVFGNQYTFTSLSKEYAILIGKIPIKLYYLNKNCFDKNKKMESRVCQNSLGLIKMPYHEYVTAEEVIPNREIIITVEKLVNYTTHNIKDTIRKVIIKAFLNYLLFRKKSLTRIN